MIDVSPKTLKRLLAEDDIPVINLGPRCERILTTDLVDFLWHRRRVSGRLDRTAEFSTNTKEQVLKTLRN